MRPSIVLLNVYRLVDIFTWPLGTYSRQNFFDHERSNHFLCDRIDGLHLHCPCRLVHT
uniref:Uncharacterized protein n=1 Tax=Arundo donax TaxID=35708 RepID=A0A0A9FHM8_ARUDO